MGTCGMALASYRAVFPRVAEGAGCVWNVGHMELSEQETHERECDLSRAKDAFFTVIVKVSCQAARGAGGLPVMGGVLQ